MSDSSLEDVGASPPGQRDTVRSIGKDLSVAPSPAKIEILCCGANP